MRNHVQVAGQQFASFEDLAVLADGVVTNHRVSDLFAVTLREYRTALAGLDAASKETSGGTKRQQDAVARQKRGIRDGCEAGKSVAQIWAEVGPVVYIENAFAKLVADEYLARARSAESELLRLIDRHRLDLIDHLESREQRFPAAGVLRNALVEL